MKDTTLLGQEISYPNTYDPTLLQGIPRQLARQSLWGDTAAPEMVGVDIWTAYELSWLNSRGKPQVAIAEFAFPASSPNIVESKSFKYYLNSFNQWTLVNRAALIDTLHKDLSECAGAPVEVNLFSLDQWQPKSPFVGECVDDIDIDLNCYTPSPELLVTSGEKVSQQLFSHLLKSNCPVTGQPDWATVWVDYCGAEIKPASFLAYVVSFRDHQGFHENCVEKIYHDIMTCCKPERLSVYARYTRRGGLDINPFRSSSAEGALPPYHQARQ